MTAEVQNVPFIGAHMSISGGMVKAIERGESIECRAIQVFTKNNNRWKGKAFTPQDIDAFRKGWEASCIDSVIAHDCYLINLASPKEELLEKSRLAFIDEMERCHRLGIQHLVFHPGSHNGTGEEEGLNRVAESVNHILDTCSGFDVFPTFETTAGQGTNLGYSFQHFSHLLERIEQKEKIRFCIDTCHIFAAGYDISTEEGYAKTFKEFDELIGIEKIACFHLNDSKKGLGSRVDRHEHIGKGCIGKNAFSFLMKDPRFTQVPKVLETPKGEELQEDRENLGLLRELCG